MVKAEKLLQKYLNISTKGIKNLGKKMKINKKETKS